MSDAPGQLFGFALQFQRALFHLLDGGAGLCVCVEVAGDVSISSQAGVISEEDKSSLSANPVTDKSINLWKTFHNWIKMISSQVVDSNNAKFILYTNHAGQRGIVNIFDEAKSPEAIKIAIEQAEEIFKAVDENHPIFQYLSFVLNNKDIFDQILLRFEFKVGSKTGGEEVKKKLIEQMLVPEGQVDFMHEELLGWVTGQVMGKIARKEDALIRWEDYKARFSVIFGRARGRELIDFTKEFLAESDDVKKQLMAYPYYLRQLEIIGLEESNHVLAVSDYLRSKINIEKWIEDELIDEDQADDLEDRLKRFWESSRNKIGIINKNNSCEERGQLVYFDCISRQEMVANQNPPASTIPGLYHNLANDDELGWHESWKDHLKK